MKSWLQDHDKEMYSTHNEEKSVTAAEISIRTFKNKIYQYMIMFILINQMIKLINTVHIIARLK